ncbi:MAG: ATP-binding protein [Kiritimatiellae bacterium]|nr:ATP-binding protein [Kiritimatiellia bacterium]MDD4736168.1 ATP-binding protein [Kiritimatiellia bacterium]
MKSRGIFWHILVSFIALSFVMLVGMATYAVVVLESMYYRSVEEALLSQARIIQTRVLPLLERNPEGIQGVCMDLKSNGVSRVSVIFPDGHVAGDTQEDPGVMENHAGRPEVQAVQSGQGHGMAIRKSKTLNIDMMYVAVPMIVEGRPAGVIRTAMPLTLLLDNYRKMRLRILAAAGAMLLVSVLLSLIVSHRISRPLMTMQQASQQFARGDFSLRVHLSGSSEVESLADSMNWMAAQLDERISTIQEQQCRMESIISSMREGVVALDYSNLIITMNQAAARMLGTSVEQATGRMLEEVVRHQTLCNLVSEVRGGRDMPESNVTMYDASEPRNFQVRATPLRTAGKRMIGVLLVLNDVTRLRSLEKIRREFVANVSHELKTPVTAIQGFAETLLNGENDQETINRFLEIIRRQTGRLNAIIEDLLNLSRLERDREHGEIQMGRFSLRKVLDNAVQCCRHEAERRGMSLEVEGGEELKLDMNAELMEQAVVNLINNALKYSDENKTVRIRAAIERNEALISVTDEGFGIAAEHLPRLFERFYRVDKNRSRQMGGTGLGLAIVKHIVMAHGGRVDVESEPGKGSCFTIHLPAA